MLAGAELQPRADAERVVLAAAGAERLELDVQGEVAVPELVAQQTRRAGGIDEREILVAVVVDVGDRDRGGARGAQRRGENARSVEEFAGAVVAEEEERRLAAAARLRTDDEIEPAVVVVVDERRGGDGEAAQRAQRGVGARVARERAVAAVAPERRIALAPATKRSAAPSLS